MSSVLHIRWQQCPVTAVCFLTGGMLLVGSGNVLQLYHICTSYVVWTWHFRNSVTIHSIQTCSLPGKKKSAIAVAGNRFYAGLLFDALSSHVSLVFDAYFCDSIVHSSILGSSDCLFFCFLSAHSEVTVLRVSFFMGQWKIDISASSGISSTICYSGFVVCKGTQSLAQALTFSGSTFGKIVIRHHTIRYGTSRTALVENMRNAGTLCCQKGLVFCISLHLKSSEQSILLASSAEDRTIAIWERSLDIHDGSPSIDKYAGPWTLLYLLDGNSPGPEVHFNSRIWKVCVTDNGVLATGEDCRVVWYPLLDITRSRVIKHSHRGHGVWSCAVWFGNENHEKDALIATGGNDGAVCVHPMPSRSETVSVVLRVSDDHRRNNKEPNVTEDNEKASDSPSVGTNGKDFPRCLFFSPTGRLFYLTDTGRYFTTSRVEYSNSVPLQTDVKPLFRYGYMKLLDDIECHTQTLQHPASSNPSVEFTKPPYCESIFRGYTVCATNRFRSFVAIGDRYGKVGLFLISEGPPYLVCTDLLNVKRKIMRLLWVDHSLLLIGAQGGLARLISVEVDGHCSCIFHDSVARLCGSEDTWVTAAHHLPSSLWPFGVTNHSVLLLGLRDGGLCSYAFQPTSLLQNGLDWTPTWSLDSCHGHGGCSSIASVPTSSPPLVLSCGRRYGEIRQWLVGSDGQLTLLSQILNPDGITWVERFHTTMDGRLFAFGFQSVHFKAYPLHSTSAANSRAPRFSLECLSGPPMFRVVCGGAHRHWDFWVPESSFEAHLSHPKVSSTIESVPLLERIPRPVFAFIKQRDIVVQSDHPPFSSSHSTLKESTHLRPSLHGKDLNCCLMVSCRCTSPVDHPSDEVIKSSTLLFCFAGGEDNYLSSWALKVNSAQGEDATFLSAPEHHRGHISSIRCLAVSRTIGLEPKTGETGRFIVTGGGRGQIGLWRFSITDFGTGDLWRPGLLGYTLLRLIKSTDARAKRPTHANSPLSSTSPSLSADLRVMAVLCSETSDVSHHLTRLLILAACSDGSIRLLVVSPPNHMHPKDCKFTEVGSLHQLCSGTHGCHPSACYLDLQWIKCGTSNCLHVLTTNTLGCVECWSVCHVFAETTSFSVLENWSLSAEPIAPFYVATAPAFNCVDTFAPISSERYFAVGGDDGSVRVGRFLFFASSSSSPSWITAAIHHHATVIRLRVVVRDSDDASGIQRFLTLSADQRLIVWSWSGTKLNPLCCSLLPGLGDPHDLSINWLPQSQAGTVEEPSTWALAVGTGLLLLQLEVQV